MTLQTSSSEADEVTVLRRRVDELERQIAELRQAPTLHVHHYPTQGAAGYPQVTYFPNAAAMAPFGSSCWLTVPPQQDSAIAPGWALAATAPQ